MSLPIDQFYERLLKSLSLDIDPSGLVGMKLEDQVIPCTVQKHRLALPTQTRIRSGEWDGLVAFHPLSENVARGVSPVLKKLRDLINYRLNSVAMVLMEELMAIASDRSYQDKLKPDQGSLLETLNMADEKTYKAMQSIFDNLSTGGPRSLVNLYMKRGGKLGAEKFSRLAVVNFPISDELDDEKPEVFDKKLTRKRDKRMIRNLFYWVFPEADSLEYYSCGSNSMISPYFESLCLAYVKVAKELNRVTGLFKQHLDDPDGLHIDLSWTEALPHLEMYRDVIPPLEGNQGNLVKGSEQTDEHSTTAARRNHRERLFPEQDEPSAQPEPFSETQRPSNPTTRNWNQQPQEQPMTQPSSSNDKITFEEIVQKRRQMANQPPGYPLMGQPNTGYPQNPGYPPMNQSYGAPPAWANNVPPQPPQGYPPQGGFPQNTGYPPNQGYPPQGGFPPNQGYPPQGYGGGPYGNPGYQNQPNPNQVWSGPVNYGGNYRGGRGI